MDKHKDGSELGCYIPMCVMSFEFPNLGDGGICLIHGDFDNGNVKVLCSRMSICMLSQKPRIIRSQAHPWDMDLTSGATISASACFARFSIPIPVAGITVGNLKELFVGHCLGSKRGRSSGGDGGDGRLNRLIAYPNDLMSGWAARTAGPVQPNLIFARSGEFHPAPLKLA
jgi:hypothetical protein